MEKTLQRNDILIRRKFNSYLVPGVMMAVAMQLGNIIDCVFVRRWIGLDDLSAISLSMPVLILMQMVGLTIGGGCAATVSVMLGKRQIEKASEVVSASILAVIALIYRGEREWKTLPVALSAFDEIRTAIFAAAGDTPESRQALLACDEAMANIVNYSEAANLAFFCDKKDGQLRVSFSDDGIPFDPTASSQESKEFEALDKGGMGLALIRQSVSSMHYERKCGRNVFTLYFPLF